MSNESQDMIQGVPELPNSIFSVYDVPMATQIKWAAENRIKMFYPEYKQLNVLMSEVSDDIIKMRNFINAIRAWANSNNPQLNDVNNISP